MEAIITSPSLDATRNISGISSVTAFIIRHNTSCKYIHFTLGKADNEARGLRGVLRNLSAYLHWVSLVLSHRHTAIHFNLALDTRGVLRDLPLIFVARVFCRRIIVHLHGGEFSTGREMPYWVRCSVGHVLAKGPIIVLSEHQRNTLRKTLPKATIAVLPNCAEIDDAKAFDPEHKDVGRLTILFLGRISTNKGLGTIHNALKSLRSRGVAFRFIMAGSGPDENTFVNRFSDLLGDDFQFSGVVTGAEKTRLLQTCDIFLLPSLFEGMPMSLLECMAFGMVPITTAVGSIPNVVKHWVNGILVGKDSPEEIVDAVERLAHDNKALALLGQCARRNVLEWCDPAQYVTRLNEIYAYDERFGLSRGN